MVETAKNPPEKPLPPSVAASTRKGEETRQRILQTAAKLFHRRSYRSVSIDDVATEAGVNKATVYQHFKSKDQLAIAGLRLHRDFTREKVLDAATAVSGDPIRRLESVFQKLSGLHEEMVAGGGGNPGCPFVNMANELSTENEAIRRVVADAFEEAAEWHAENYRRARRLGISTRDADPRRVGRQVQMIVNGVMTWTKAKNSIDDLMDALDAAKRTMGLSI